MDESTQPEVARLIARLVELTALAEHAIGKATTALLGNDVVLADEVLGADRTVRALHKSLDRDARYLLAHRRNRSGDLRRILDGLRMSVDLERMGMLACHVAEVAEQRCTVPDSLRPIISGMGDVACRLATQAREVLVSRDADEKSALASDDEMDRLQESLIRRLSERNQREDVETVVDLTLLARYYERFADHAIAIADRVTSLPGRNFGLNSDADAG